ncbi:PREDICTED: meiosis-expressed gene 1 protein-like [Amphimedon queenslandica]|uniref:Meiosis expressed gene 1 protein homolog n=1 Tax=Amphimedon queenslandica TaxID=400682 RepID=A0AAN0IM68_AMPQE|nr:PREDICTED: meiosis-expressed gene 1 protein-like [Amphimedon queenslandica]|eukprot:XP_011403910.1 PREDICTED: meiosis-expressed gene 1 protein-like [Amphimedon queenslandica]
MAAVEAKPKSVRRAKYWDENVEEAYRFQLAGYRDEIEYSKFHPQEVIDRWPHNNYIKKLKRRNDGLFYYYNKERECLDKEIHKIKLYTH